MTPWTQRPNLRAVSPFARYPKKVDPDAAQMAGFPARDRSDHMAHWHKILGVGAVTARTVLVNGRLAGNVVGWDQESGREVGYWIGKGYWGKGVVTAA